MRFIHLLKGKRFEHRDAHDHLTSAARYWLPSPASEMEVRNLVREWVESGRRAAERRSR